MKLKEIRLEEEDDAHQQRAGRLAKWREMAQQAAQEHCPKLQLPTGIEMLNCFVLAGGSAVVGRCWEQS